MPRDVYVPFFHFSRMVWPVPVDGDGLVMSICVIPPVMESNPVARMIRSKSWILPSAVFIPVSVNSSMLLDRRSMRFTLSWLKTSKKSDSKLIRFVPKGWIFLAGARISATAGSLIRGTVFDRQNW